MPRKVSIAKATHTSQRQRSVGKWATIQHEVVEAVAERKEEFSVEDLVEEWNNKFEEKKSSKAIRHWVEFLCDIGYVTKKPNPADRRSVLLSVIKQKNSENTVFDFSIIFELDLLKAWLNELKKYSTETQVLLYTNFFADNECSLEEVWKKFFYIRNSFAGEYFLSDSEASFGERSEENMQFSKAVHSERFSVNEVRSLERISSVVDKCVCCGFQGRMDWQVIKHNGERFSLCRDCGWQLQKQLAATDKEKKPETGRSEDVLSQGGFHCVGYMMTPERAYEKTVGAISQGPMKYDTQTLTSDKLREILDHYWTSESHERVTAKLVADGVLSRVGDERSLILVCGLCGQLLPPDLRNTTSLDGKHVHLQCYKWKRGQRKPEP